MKILTCCRELGYSLDKTNILGGALAYGHPYGASGAIILLHLLKALEQMDGRFGVAAIGAESHRSLDEVLAEADDAMYQRRRRRRSADA